MERAVSTVHPEERLEEDRTGSDDLARAPGGGERVSSERRTTLRLVTHVSAGTLELGLSVAAGAGIGYVLDTVVFDGRTTPWLTLFWLLCGVIAGFRSLFRVLRRLQQDGEQEGNGNPPG